MNSWQVSNTDEMSTHLINCRIHFTKCLSSVKDHDVKPNLTLQPKHYTLCGAEEKFCLLPSWAKAKSKPMQWLHLKSFCRECPFASMKTNQGFEIDKVAPARWAHPGNSDFLNPRIYWGLRSRVSSLSLSLLSPTAL